MPRDEELRPTCPECEEEGEGEFVDYGITGIGIFHHGDCDTTWTYEDEEMEVAVILI